MPLKIFRAMWFLSVLALFASLLLGYASWQENMIIQDQASGQVSMNRDMLFYALVAVFLLVNVMVYVIAKAFVREENFRAWFHGLVIAINIFFIVAINLIGLYNSFESYDYSRLGIIVYGCIGLIVLWAMTWPLYLIYRKILLNR